MKPIKHIIFLLLIILILSSCRSELPLKIYSGYYWEMYGSSYKFLGNNTVLSVAHEHMIPHDTVNYDFGKYRIRNSTLILKFRDEDWSFRRKLIYIDSLDRFLGKNNELGEFIKSNGIYMDSLLMYHPYIKNHY